MFKGRYVLLLMFVQSFEFIQTKQCNIPEDNEDIDWDKFPDEWYQVLHTNDAVMGKDVYGGQLQNFTKTSTGAKTVVTELHKNSPPQTFIASWREKGAGIYRLEKSDESAAIASQSLTPEGGTSEDAVKLEHALFDGDILILNDEKNYLIFVFCSPSDEWVVWVLFPTMKPTIHQVTLMWNKLMAKGINVQLHLAEVVKHPEIFMGFTKS
uniref:uncharacterized protein LOC120330068 n=1 Tax=Styela clava TaxID=7725 RepID=UPI0019392A39|nr:uncharacterized protein LOC120330068 [Styela clava]